MVEVNLNQDSKVPPAMLIAFTVCTTLLVGVHMLALMISTCILPNIDAVCSMNNVNLVHESPHERLHWYIEAAWAFSTLLGLILFLFEIAILCWVKFYEISQVAAWSACAVLIPVLVVFVAFAVHFYQTMVAHKYEVSRYGIRELELLKEQIEVNDSSNAHSPNSTIEVTSNYSRTQIVWRVCCASSFKCINIRGKYINYELSSSVTMSLKDEMLNLRNYRVWKIKN